MDSRAKWIWAPCDETRNSYVRFEDAFMIEADGRTMVSVSASGEYVLEINGIVAGFGQFGDWPENKTVNIHDISAYCSRGKNRLSLLAWHQGLDTSVSADGPARACFSVAQGDQLLLCSSENTPCRVEAQYRNGDMPRITPQLGYGFAYDANAPEPEWSSAVLVSAPSKVHERRTGMLAAEPVREGQLCAQGVFCETADKAELPAVRMLRAALSMRRVKELDDGGWYAAEDGDGLYLIYDLGRESAGYLTLELETEEETEILIGWGEHLTDLRVRTAVGGRSFSTVYRAKPGKNAFTHWLRRLGCRYIQLHVYAKRVRIHRVGLIPVVYPLAKQRALRCADTIHEQIDAVARETLRLCMHDHYEDCPWREQALYAMDSREQMLCGYYAFGETALPRASLQLLAEGQRSDGLLELCAPAKVPITIPCFSLAFAVELWEYALYSGDLQIDGLLDVALRILETFEKRLDDRGRVLWLEGKQYWNFYEWQPGLDGYSVESGTEGRAEGLLTAWYALALDAVIRCCQATGRTEQAALLQPRLSQTRVALEDFWDEEREMYAAVLSQGERKIWCSLMQALTLLSGACPEPRASRLRERLKSEDGMIPVTLNDALLRYEALMQDEGRYADFVFDDIARVWGAMLRKDATSFWETALGEADFDHAGSLCHGWSAIPVYFYHAYGNGLRPVAPGKMGSFPVVQTRLGAVRFEEQ